MNRFKLIFLIVLTLITGSIKAQSPLCSSYPTNFCCEYVSSVTINGQTYNGSNGYAASSGGTGPNGYYDYTGGTPVPTITAGQNISITYTAQTNGNYMEYFKLWVDFNGNGVLSDPGEQVYAHNVSWLGTKTVTSTFQVPTTVFNGQVYMRFMMVYANVPALCGSYAYGNTFDFKTNITGAISTFNYSGSVLNSNNAGVNNVPVQLWVSPKNQNSFTLNNTYLTNSSGNFSINTTIRDDLNDFKLIVGQPQLSQILQGDAESAVLLSLSQNPSTLDYYRWNVNGDSIISISDAYVLYKRTFSINLMQQQPLWRYFTSQEWSQITTSSGNLTSSYPGQQSITLTNPITGGSNTFYLIRTGKTN